jgi:hypothetical protein
MTRKQVRRWLIIAALALGAAAAIARTPVNPARAAQARAAKPAPYRPANGC